MKKKSKITIGIICVASIVVIGAGLVLARKLLSPKKAGDTTYRVKKETYENVIEISGTVAAASEQKLQALSSGTVIGVYVKEGDKVKKGDTIIQLDATDQIYNLEKHDYETASKQISGSKRELELRETERLALVQKINDRKVTATFDGVIAALDVAVGDSLEAKDSVGTLVNTDYLTAEVEVAETDVSKLQVGQEVDFTFSAYKNETVKGYVTGWPAIGEITSRGATIVKVKIRIDDYPDEILPNYSFTGKIMLSPTEENLVVERYAIGYEDKKPYVELARTGERIYVTTRPYGSEYVKITSGLNGNEVLKAQSEPLTSGWNRGRGGAGGEGAPGGGDMGGGPGGGMGGGGGGAGGPPPGM